MIKADNTQKRCFVACDEQTRKNGRCSCLTNSHQALQLQQTGVKSSVSIELKDWDYECADGCCTSFGTKLLLNGKELEHPNEEILDNSYVGCDVQTALHAGLKELGYEVTFV